MPRIHPKCLVGWVLNPNLRTVIQTQHKEGPWCDSIQELLTEPDPYGRGKHSPSNTYGPVVIGGDWDLDTEKHLPLKEHPNWPSIQNYPKTEVVPQVNAKEPIRLHHMPLKVNPMSISFERALKKYDQSKWPHIEELP
jgi:hypothetical protein